MNEIINVLLVEDDIVDVQLVERTLHHKSDDEYEIVHVASLKEALELNSERFDVVLLDLSLPDSNGLETVSSIVEVYGELPIIVVTGNIDPAIGKNVVKLGADDYCTKREVDTYPLVRTIQHAILRKKAQQLESQVQKSQRLESLGMLAGGIAHDFTNMLLIVLSNIDLALMTSGPESGSTRYLASVKTAALRLTELTEQMLAYAGKGSFASELVDLSSLVNEMGQLLQVSVSKKVAINYDLHGELPKIKADPSQLRQIVLNLITNASDAIGDNNGEIKLTTGVLEPIRHPNNSLGDNRIFDGDHCIFIEVSDTGVGMAEEEVGKIFEPFYTSKASGHGLGLAAVLSIVNGHGGDIDVSSSPDQGTTFRILLPYIPEEIDAENISDVLENWRGSGTVLVVDDEEMVRQATKEYIELLGFTALTARDGLEAVQIVAQRKTEIAVVVLNLSMPVMGGIEAFARIREISPTQKILLMSGYEKKAATRELIRSRQAIFIRKPFDLKSLRRALKDTIDHEIVLEEEAELA